MTILDRIHSPADVKALAPEQLPELCQEIRAFLIQSVAKTGGHLASNLGAVELTVAIHRVFDTETDRLVFDVGHQSYVHKLLTGRREAFSTLRSFGGMAGFPKPAESVHDACIAGHASGSVSVALGFARARTLAGAKYHVAALLGDGALTGGLAYEALSDAGDSGEPMVVILNDNGIAITPNVGGTARHLAHLRLRPGYRAFKTWYRKITSKVPGGRFLYRLTHGIKQAVKQAALHCSLFEDIGFEYFGPVDGHDLRRLEEVLTWARDMGKPVLVHVITKKGKGYPFSEAVPELYHGVPPFDPLVGVVPGGGVTFSDVFGTALTELAQTDPRITAITAAMTSGTGLTRFAKDFPARFFDVGIAEGHAAAMAAGLAAGGAVPVLAVYSTFLQRAYDMLLHDIAISGLHVVLAVDRAGLVGEDGETHQGIFDVGYLCSVPGMTVLSPASFAELRDMLAFAVRELDGPVAIRYPRGGEGRYTAGGVETARVVRPGSDCTIVTYGTAVNTALDAAALLEAQGVSAEIVKLGILSPLDYTPVQASVEKTGCLLVLEPCADQVCLGRKIAAHLEMSGVNARVILKNTGTGFVPHGSVAALEDYCGIDAAHVAEALWEVRQ